MSQTVRISEEPHRILRELAARLDESMQSVLAKAIEEYRRKVMFDQANDAYARLQNDSHAWGEELAERELWDAAAGDGLEPSEIWKPKKKVNKRGRPVAR